MPLLFALVQHSALVVSDRLQEGEFLFTFHDDLCIKSLPNRTGSGRTSLSVTWTWVSLVCWMAGGWRSLRTGSHSAQSTERNPKTPERIMSTGLRCSTLGETKRRRTLSWLGEVAERGLSCWQERLGAFLRRNSPVHLQFGVATPGQHGLDATMECVVELCSRTSFCLIPVGWQSFWWVDGETPHVQEVLAATRHLG